MRVEIRVVVIAQSGHDRLELVGDFDMTCLPGIDHQIMIGGLDGPELTVQAVQHILDPDGDDANRVVVVTCMTLDRYRDLAEFMYRWGFVIVSEEQSANIESDNR